jgi:hypothetical protein
MELDPSPLSSLSVPSLSGRRTLTKWATEDLRHIMSYAEHTVNFEKCANLVLRYRVASEDRGVSLRASAPSPPTALFQPQCRSR